MLSGTERSGVQSKHLPPQRQAVHSIDRITEAMSQDEQLYGLFQGCYLNLFSQACERDEPQSASHCASSQTRDRAKETTQQTQPVPE